jgi:hypothetical protein
MMLGGKVVQQVKSSLQMTEETKDFEENRFMIRRIAVEMKVR